VGHGDKAHGTEGEHDAKAEHRVKADGEASLGAVAKEKPAVAVDLTEPMPYTDHSADGGELAKAATSIKSGAAPSNALGAGDYGLTFPESVSVTISAAKTVTDWSPVVKTVTGHYSMQTRLLPGQHQVTGPGGNTTKANFCDQVTGLTTLGNTAGNKWYMLQAVKRHEAVHESRFKPALDAVLATITTSIESVKIPDAKGMNATSAAVKLKANAAFTAAVSAAQATWLAEILTRVAGDHASGGPAETAEHTVVDPMVTKICTHAKAKKWPACPACP